MSHHNPNHGEVDKHLIGFGQALTIFVSALVAVKPTKGAIAINSSGGGSFILNFPVYPSVIDDAELA
ncbi:MAG: hypothetical protein F6K00_05180 [Leptolyngbya sp. SIOISBB]|nr:hypothetical protein [Leptolyngbya sp. SIOISBB]